MALEKLAQIAEMDLVKIAQEEENNNSNIAMGVGGATALGGAGMLRLSDNFKNKSDRLEARHYKMINNEEMQRLRSKADDATLHKLINIDDYGYTRKHTLKLETAKDYREINRQINKALDEARQAGNFDEIEKLKKQKEGIKGTILKDDALKGNKFFQRTTNLDKAKKIQEDLSSAIDNASKKEEVTNYLINKRKRLARKYSQMANNLAQKGKYLEYGGKAAIGLGAGAMLAGAYNKMKNQ